MNDDSELERHRWERLLRWLSRDHCMDVGDGAFYVEAREVPDAGRGLFASRDCPQSTVLFKVPAAALMNKTTIAKLYPQLRGRRLSGVQLVSLHLYLHKPHGEEDSRDPVFGPYISTLPRDFSSHPLTWLVKRDAREADTWENTVLSLLPPSAFRKLSALRDRFRTDWKTVGRVLEEDATVAVSSSRSDALPVSSHDMTMNYLWAWLNVNTRCIFYRIQPKLSDPDNFTLCPVLDLANHSSGRTHIFPVVDSEVWGEVAKKPPKYFIFYGPSEEPVQQGQQLYLRYGAHSNAFLFTEYGFVNEVIDDAITNDTYAGEVDVQELVEGVFAEKGSSGIRLKEILMDEGYWGDWTMHAAPTPAHPSYRLMAALRLLHAFDDFAQAGSPAFDAIVARWRSVINGQADKISPQNEERWRASLHDLCGRIAGRARTHLSLCSTVEYTCMQDNWRVWMHSNICSLWQEELEVAEAVVMSLDAGVEF